MLQVRLSGGLALSRDGHPVDLPRSRRGRALLAWLALHPGLHARGTLAARFWPDVLDTSARTSLRAALTELRNALGEDADVLLATREAVGLGRDAAVDVRTFAARLAAGDPAGALAAVDGELLTGMDEDWVHTLRAEHNARAGEALRELAAQADAAGDRATAVAHARRAAALDPLDEAAHRDLIRRLDHAGDRARALRTGEQLAERLRTQLGIAPAPQTRALLAALRAGADLAGVAAPDHGAEPPFVPRTSGTKGGSTPREGAPPSPSPLLPPPSPLPPAVARAAQEPFAGRTADLTRLAELTERPGRRLVVVTGEPGLGKTRVVLRAAAAAHARGATVLLGRCTAEREVAYGPVAEALQQAGHPLPTDMRDRAQLFDAADAAISSHAHPVLIVDDLQWADPGTTLLLAALLQSTRTTPLTILATARGVTAQLGRLERAGETHVHPLPPLDTTAIAHLTPTADGAALQELQRRSGGNAFYVRELLRDPGWLPRTVRAQLSPDADALISAAAVLGERAPIGPLLATAQLEDEPAELALTELEQRHLLRTTASGVEFAHALVREAVLSDLNAIRRRRLHRAAAQALPPQRVEQRAHHLLEAGEREQAVPVLMEAADRAMAQAAYEEAARFRADALDAMDADDDRRPQVLIATGDALNHAGDRRTARARFAEAGAVARRTQDARLLAQAALGTCGITIEIHDVDEARVALLEEALHATPDSERGTRSALLARLAVALYYAPARDHTEALSAEAVLTAHQAGDPRTLAQALNARHVALWRADRVTQRLEVAQEMIEAAQEANDPSLQLQARNWRITDLYELGDMHEWHAEVARHSRLAQELRLPSFTWYTPLWASVAARDRGDRDEAERLRLRARAEGMQAQDSNAWLFTEMLAFNAGLLDGDLSRMDWAWVEDRLETSATAPAYLSGYSWAKALTGEHDVARAFLERVIADDFGALPYNANWISAVAEAMEAALILEHRPAAELVARTLAPYAGLNVTAGRAVQSYGCVDRQLGHAAAVLGDLPAAREHYTRAIALDSERGITVWADRTRAALRALPDSAPG